MNTAKLRPTPACTMAWLRRTVAILLFLMIGFYFSPAETAGSQTLQSQLDQECANISAELCNEGEFEHCINPMEYARIIQGETSQDTWWCFSGMDIQKRNVGKHCVNNCGVKANCRGVPTSSPSLAINKDKELRTALSNNKDTYCRAYYERLSSVAASSALQLILDAECLKQHAASCKLGNTRHCQPAVARFTYDEMNGNWSFRCYASQELEYKKTDNGCVDSCGDFAACSGAVGASAVSIDAEQELALLYLNVQPQTCKMNIRN